MRYKIEITIVLLIAQAIGFINLLAWLWGLLAYPNDGVDAIAGIGIVVVLFLWAELMLMQVKFISKIKLKNQKNQTNEKN